MELPLDCAWPSTLMETTEGRHLSATASASDASSSTACTDSEPEAPRLTVDFEPPIRPNPAATPSASTHATKAPANAMRNVLPLVGLDAAAAWEECACTGVGSYAWAASSTGAVTPGTGLPVGGA